MQLPPTDELVLVSGTPPIRAKKARYFEDRQLKSRVIAPPVRGQAPPRGDDPQAGWPAQPPAVDPPATPASDATNAGIRREPGMASPEAVAPECVPANEFEFTEPPENSPALALAPGTPFGVLARQAVMDPADGLGL